MSVRMDYPEKKVVIEGGAEITYFELGEENEEILVIGQWYFYTFQDWMRELAKSFHLYAMILRGDGPTDQMTADGSQVSWEKQWAEDIYRFAQALNLGKFIYGGKCHGSFPVWQLATRHPEVLKAVIASSWVPNKAQILAQKAMAWGKGIATDLEGTIATSLRKEKNLEAKLEEVRSIDASKMISLPTAQPGNEAASMEEIYDLISKISVPVMVTAGYEDPLMDIPTLTEICRYLPSTTSKVVLYPGERHFYEMDTPDRLASEWAHFIEQIKAGEYCN